MKLNLFSNKNKGSFGVNKTDAGNNKNEITTETKAPCLGVRHLQGFLLFCGLSVSYAMRVNLSVAIVAMTDNSSNIDFKEYDWNEKIKSLILSSFFWGYGITQIPAGQLARRFGGKIMLFCGVLPCSVLCVLTPIFAKIGDWQLVVALRVIQGFSQGVVLPSTHTLLSKWAPIEDRGSFNACVYSGCQFGTFIMLAISGVLATSAIGWPSIFYFSGGLGILWTLVYLTCGANSPNQYKNISPAELKLYENSLGQQAGNEDNNQNQAAVKIPWLQFMTSPAFLVVIVSNCTQNWGFWTLLTEIPTYMTNVYDLDIKSNALLSALPYFAMFIMCFVFSFMAIQLNRWQCMPLSVSRKVFNSIGQLVPMVTLICLSYVTADQTSLAIALLTITVGVNAATYLGFQVNHIDLAPNFAGVLMGITNCAGNIMSIIAPLIVGVVVTDETNPNQWRVVFFIAAGLYFIGNLLFVIFGKTEVQPWNDPDTKNETKPSDPAYMES